LDIFTTKTQTVVVEGREGGEKREAGWRRKEYLNMADFSLKLKITYTSKFPWKFFPNPFW
jgi:hypothetical protein